MLANLISNQMLRVWSSLTHHLTCRLHCGPMDLIRKSHVCARVFLWIPTLYWNLSVPSLVTIRVLSYQYKLFQQIFFLSSISYFQKKKSSPNYKTPWPWRPPAGQSPPVSSGRSSSPGSPWAVHDQVCSLKRSAVCSASSCLSQWDDLQ